MSESNRIFSDWTQRCSGISYITSSAVTITETQLANLEKLQQCFNKSDEIISIIS